MNDFILKYSNLSNAAKQEVNKLIEALSLGEKKTVSKSNRNFQKSLLEVSSWSDEDIKPIEEKPIRSLARQRMTDRFA